MAIQLCRSHDDRQLLQKAVDNCKWQEVLWCLKSYTYPNSLLCWAIEKLAEHGDVERVRQVLAMFGMGDIMLPHLVRRRMGLAVYFALCHSKNAEQKRWAVLEASKWTGDGDYFEKNLIFCSSSDLDEVVKNLVMQGRWMSVRFALQKGITEVTETQHRWAIMEGSQLSDDWEFYQYLLPCCTDKELEEVVPHLISRGMWKSLGQVLKNTSNPILHHYIIQEAIQHADDNDFVEHVLYGCSPQDAEQVLQHLVSRNLWKNVRFTLTNVSADRRQWAIEEGSQHADERDFVDNVLCHCSEDQLDLVVTNMVSRGLWNPADSTAHINGGIKLHILKQLLSHHHWRALREFFSRDSDVTDSIPILEEAVKQGADLYTLLPPRYVELMPMAVQLKQWKWTNALVFDVASYTLCNWVFKQGVTLEPMLWKLVHYCSVPVSQALPLSKAVFMVGSGRVDAFDFFGDFESFTSLSECLGEIFTNSLLKTICYAVCNANTDSICISQHESQQAFDIYSDVISCLKDNRNFTRDKTQSVIPNKAKWLSVFTETANIHKDNPLFLLHFLRGLHIFHSIRQGQRDDATLLKMLAVFPLFPQLQSEALRLMVRQQRWEVISQACLSHVWEHDRRQLFKVAVEQRQWDVVRQWADHSLHDDQRHWAMKEAFQEKQWGVYLLLVDFGLTVREQMHAHYMMAKYADWDTVLAMMERGGDVAEVRWLLDNFAKGRLRRKPHGDVSVFEQRCQRLEEEEESMREKCHQDGIQALERSQWRTVLFHILHGPRDGYFAAVTDRAIQDQAWNVLMHVVRLGMNSAERDALFPAMVRQQQWAVSRMLLECGVHVCLCLEALPELLERNQWTLVARVMEYSVDDAVRCQVMQYAFQRREGVLFWHCLTTMENQDPVSVETRVRLFHQAISRDVWQALKPLVEEKDESGIQCRDLAFLEGIEQHLWDVVDHCQVQGANINMKDENGESPVLREARKREWKAVEEMVYRGADPNLLDKEGVSVLNRLITYRQWDTVKFVIKYGADIHLVARNVDNLSQPLPKDQTFCSPLQLLISARKIDIIHFSLMWCPNQGKGVNHHGQTTLHTACASGRWDMLQDLVCRKADPLAVTFTGRSALAYAVLNADCPQHLVAQCITLGFSTHQPALTRLRHRVVDDIICHLETRLAHGIDLDKITSPFLLALLRGSIDVAGMLYESGACSHAEVRTLWTQVPDLVDPSTVESTKLYHAFYWMMVRLEDEDIVYVYDDIRMRLKMALPLLNEMATQPRSLKSSCRLLICRCLDVRGKRHRDIQRLPLTQDMRDYLLFPDLTTCHSLT